MQKGMNQGKLAVESGVWPLYRYDPRLKAEGKNPFQLDSKEPDMSKIETYVWNETRFKTLRDADPDRANALLGKSKGLRGEGSTKSTATWPTGRSEVFQHLATEGCRKAALFFYWKGGAPRLTWRCARGITRGSPALRPPRRVNRLARLRWAPLPPLSLILTLPPRVLVLRSGKPEPCRRKNTARSLPWNKPSTAA